MAGGSAQTLRDYWTHHAHGGPTHFAGADAIAWGTPGDFNRCVALVSRHMSPEQAKGYCNLRHKEALGYYPATHARMEGGKMQVPDVGGAIALLKSNGGVAVLPPGQVRAVTDVEAAIETLAKAARNVRDRPSGRFRTFEGEAHEAGTAMHEGRHEEAVGLLDSARTRTPNGPDHMRPRQLRDGVAAGHYSHSAFEVRPGVAKEQPRVPAGQGTASGEFSAGQGGQNQQKPSKTRGGKVVSERSHTSSRAQLREHLAGIEKEIGKIEHELKAARRAARLAHRKPGAVRQGSGRQGQGPGGGRAQSGAGRGSGKPGKPGPPRSGSVGQLESQLAALRGQAKQIREQLGTPAKKGKTEIPALAKMDGVGIAALLTSPEDLMALIHRTGAG